MFIDIQAFQLIREKYPYWWLPPALSTILSNIIDSYVFFFAAFFNSEQIYMSDNWIEIAGTQSVFKNNYWPYILFTHIWSVTKLFFE